jgi:Tfp pilus assembly protein PilX
MKIHTSNHKTTQRKQGSALVTVMIVVTIVSLTAGSFYIFAASMAHQTLQMTDTMRAQAIAEAGANEAFSQLKADYSLRHDPSSFGAKDFADGTYTVHVETDDQARTRLVVVGAYNNAQSIIGLDVHDANRPPEGVMAPSGSEEGAGTEELVLPTENLPWSTFLNYAIFANGNLRFNGTPQSMNGHLHANWNWTLSGNYGNFSEGVLLSARNMEEAGVPEEFRAVWREVPFPELTDPDVQAFLAEADAAGQLTRLVGDRVFAKNSTFNGIWVIEGDVIFRGAGTRNVNGIFYVTGNITQNGASVNNVNGVMLAGGNILLNGSSSVFTHTTVGAYGPATAQAQAAAAAVGPTPVAMEMAVSEFTDSNAEIKVSAWWQATEADIPTGQGAIHDDSTEG